MDVDWVENIWCIGEVVKFFVDVGLIVICLFILFFCFECQMVCELVDEGEFIEVFVDMLFEVCIKCDLKGFYKKVQVGEIKNFIGFDSFYEVLVDLEICVDIILILAEEVVDQVIVMLKKCGFLG